MQAEVPPVMIEMLAVGAIAILQLNRSITPMSCASGQAPRSCASIIEAVWSSILEKGGSVQHLDFLTPEEKDVFKTSFEIDQRWLIELAADRTPYIDQATSLNLFIPADVDKWDLLMLHYRAWELGIKSLYYLRSKSVQRAGFAGGVEADNTPDLREIELLTTDYDECLACQ